MFAYSERHKIICILGTFEEVQANSLSVLKFTPNFLLLVARGCKRVVV